MSEQIQFSPFSSYIAGDQRTKRVYNVQENS